MNKNTILDPVAIFRPELVKFMVFCEEKLRERLRRKNMAMKLNYLIIVLLLAILFLIWKGEDTAFSLLSKNYRIYFYSSNGHLISELEGVYQVGQESGMVYIKNRNHKKTYLMGTIEIEERE